MAENYRHLNIRVVSLSEDTGDGTARGVISRNRTEAPGRYRCHSIGGAVWNGWVFFSLIQYRPLQFDFVYFSQEDFFLTSRDYWAYAVSCLLASLTGVFKVTMVPSYVMGRALGCFVCIFFCRFVFLVQYGLSV